MTLRRFESMDCRAGNLFHPPRCFRPQLRCRAQSRCKWETTRTTQPEDLDELKALEERVKRSSTSVRPPRSAYWLPSGSGPAAA